MLFLLYLCKVFIILEREALGKRSQKDGQRCSSKCDPLQIFSKRNKVIKYLGVSGTFPEIPKGLGLCSWILSIEPWAIETEKHEEVSPKKSENWWRWAGVGEGSRECILNSCEICAPIQPALASKGKWAQLASGYMYIFRWKARWIHSKILPVMSGRIMNGGIFYLWVI